MKRDQALSDAADAPKKSAHVRITSRRSAARPLLCLACPRRCRLPHITLLRPTPGRNTPSRSRTRGLA